VSPRRTPVDSSSTGWRSFMPKSMPTGSPATIPQQPHGPDRERQLAPGGTASSKPNLRHSLRQRHVDLLLIVRPSTTGLFLPTPMLGSSPDQPDRVR
jgi:hypothetical protein